MTRTILAILALSPALLHAQVNVPAQPSSTPVLQSTLVQPVALHAATLPASTSATPVRVSTGVIAPKLIHSVQFGAGHGAALRVTGSDMTVVVEMNLDATGKPGDLKVVKSGGEFVDQEVLSAVAQFRYQPATLDGQPTAVPVRLAVTFEHGASY